MLNINKQPFDENGKPHGEWIVYHDNDQLCYRWNWVHGIIHGFDEEYNSDRKLLHRGYWNMGKRIGHWIFNSKRKYYLCLI